MQKAFVVIDFYLAQHSLYDSHLTSNSDCTRVSTLPGQEMCYIASVESESGNIKTGKF